MHAMTAPTSQSDVLIVGVGSIGERHLRCFQQTGRINVSLCETNPELRQVVAERYGIQRTYGDLDSALADAHLAAVIATPAPSHIPISIAAAERGIHLLIEKPLSTSLEQVDRLAKTCEANRVTAAVAYVMRSHPALIAARRALGSGDFGRPLQVVAVSGQNFPYYRPAYRETYYRQRSSGGGAIQDALTHVVNSVEWLVGPVDRVLADAGHLAIPGVEVEDTVHVMARHGAVLATYSLNQHQAPNENVITTVCERGVVRVWLPLNKWAFIRATDEPWTEHQLPELPRDDLFVRQANGFLDAIDGVTQLACSLEEGASTLRASLAIIRSADAPAWTEIRTVGALA